MLIFIAFLLYVYACGRDGVETVKSPFFPIYPIRVSSGVASWLKL